MRKETEFEFENRIVILSAIRRGNPFIDPCDPYFLLEAVPVPGQTKRSVSPILSSMYPEDIQTSLRHHQGIEKRYISPENRVAYYAVTAEGKLLDMQRNETTNKAFDVFQITGKNDRPQEHVIFAA